MASYADLVTGKELAQRVVDDLDLDLSATDLAEKVTAEAAPETVLLGISVTDPDPQEAQRLTQAFSVQLADLVAELETPPGQGEPGPQGHDRRLRQPPAGPGLAAAAAQPRPGCRAGAAAWASASP